MRTTFIANPTFDDQFNRTLAAAARGCADIGEALAVAARITAGDVTSWATEWTTEAESVLADADGSHEAGDITSARRAYLRAAEYYRQAFFFARTDLDDPVLRSAYAGHLAAFRAALPLLPWACTPVDFAQDGIAVRGYLFRPDSSDTPRPTVIAPAGYDSTPPPSRAIGSTRSARSNGA